MPPLILVAYLFGYNECGGGISSRPFFFKNNSSLENDLEPFKQPLNCMRCVCRVFLLKIIWNRFMVWTLCQNFGLKGNLFSVVKYKSIIQLSLGFQCYSCSQPTLNQGVWLSKVFLSKSCGGLFLWNVSWDLGWFGVDWGCLGHIEIRL